MRYAFVSNGCHDRNVNFEALRRLPQVEAVRQSLAGALRDRVIGPNADEKAAHIMDAPGERWFAPDRPIHRVHSDASMFIGGMRALLVQSLHPRAMAGVAQHSDYRNDPWGRLQRTADFLAATSFGPADVAQQAVDRVRTVHTRVVGTTSNGEEYSANDPHLLRWVHIAEVDSFLAAHQVFGANPLDQEGRDAYVSDMAVIARKLGVPAPPESEQALRDHLREYRPELRSTRESRDAARYLLITPPLPAAQRVPYGLIAAGALSVMPVWTRVMLRLPWMPLTERFAYRPIGQVVTGAIRWVTDLDSPASRAN